MEMTLKQALIVLLIFGSLLSGCDVSTLSLKTDMAAPINSGQTRPPSVGNLKGVPLSIPSEYIFLGVQYDGDDPWQPKKRIATPTFSTSIQSFSILVHWPSLEPKTPKNEQDWRDSLKRTSAYSNWLVIGGEPSKYELPDREWFKGFITRSKDIYGGSGWYYKKIDEKRYGLTAEVMVGPDPNKIDISNQDLLYDEESWNTRIKCGAGAVAPGGNHTCVQIFLIPEMNLFVRFQYADNRLKDWKVMQEKITQLLKQFQAKL